MTEHCDMLPFIAACRGETAAACDRLDHDSVAMVQELFIAAISAADQPARCWRCLQLIRERVALQ